MGCVNVLIGISPQIKTNMLNFYLRIKIKTARFSLEKEIDLKIVIFQNCFKRIMNYGQQCEDSK